MTSIPAFLRAVGDLTLTAPVDPADVVRSDGAASEFTWTATALEFKQHRTYTPGDDVRRVDWSLYGRSKRLYTRLVQDEHQPRLGAGAGHIGVDGDRADGRTSSARRSS